MMVKGQQSTRAKGIRTLERWLQGMGWAVTMVREGQRDLIKAEKRGERRVIRISTKSSGDWQVSTRDHGALRQGRFWALVDVGSADKPVVILDEDSVRVALETDYREYLEKHGGRRPRSPQSQHQALRRPVFDDLVARCSTTW